MSDFEELEPGDAEPGPPSNRKRTCLLVCMVPLLLAACTVSALMALALQHRIRSAMTSFDTRLVIGAADGQARDMGETRHVLLSRLRGAGILGKVTVVKPGEVAVDLLSGDEGAFRGTLATSAELRFLIVVGDGQLEPEHQQLEIDRILAAQAAGTYVLAEDRYAAHPWHPEARGGDGGHLLLETAGMLHGGDFRDFYRAVDDRGRPALGFTMGPVGRKKLYSLTSKNINRQLAIVLDGEVRSAPVIRGAIGKKGIIEGGNNGWDETELAAAIATLGQADLPFPLQVLRKETLGR